MSLTYFSTLFKKLNGISPWDYIQVRRIERAIEKLRKTSSAISEIALACGYNSISNFNRSIKAYTGKTPGEYRKSVEIIK